MTHTQPISSDVISEFIRYYLDNLFSGRCRDDQYGVAFMLAKSGYMFMSVDPSPVVDNDPTSLAPKNLYPVIAHAVFKPQSGLVNFSAPKMDDGSIPTNYEMVDPVYIHFQNENTKQLWILSMNRLQLDGEPILVHRADPDTLTIIDRKSSNHVAPSLQHTLH